MGKKGLSCVTYTHQPTWTAMDWQWRGKMCTLRYVYMHWGGASSVQHELTKTQSGRIHLNRCTSLHSPQPAKDSPVFKSHKRTLAEITKLTLDCMLMKRTDGRWKLAENAGLHSWSNLLVISTLLETVNNCGELLYINMTFCAKSQWSTRFTRWRYRHW